MKLTHVVMALCLGLVVFAACKKSEDEEATPNNNNNNTPSATAQKIIDGKWQIVANVANTNYQGKDTTVDFYKEMEDCEKDNFITFASDGTCTEDQNTNKCSGAPQTETGTYKLLDNDTRIAIYDKNPDTFDLVVNSTQMTWKSNWTSSGGNIVYETLTLKNIK